MCSEEISTPDFFFVLLDYRSEAGRMMSCNSKSNAFYKRIRERVAMVRRVDAPEYM